MFGMGRVLFPEKLGVRADAHEAKLITRPVEKQEQIRPHMTFENICILALQRMKAAAGWQGNIIAKPFDDFRQRLLICLPVL